MSDSENCVWIHLSNSLSYVFLYMLIVVWTPAQFVFLDLLVNCAFGVLFTLFLNYLVTLLMMSLFSQCNCFCVSNQFQDKLVLGKLYYIENPMGHLSSYMGRLFCFGSDKFFWRPGRSLLWLYSLFWKKRWFELGHFQLYVSFFYM